MTDHESALNAIHEFLGIAKDKLYPTPDKPNSDWAKLKAAVDGLALLSASKPAAPDWPSPAAWRDKHETSDLYSRMPDPEQIDAEAMYTASQVRAMLAGSPAAPAQSAEPVAWTHEDDPRECISDLKKRDMIQYNGAPGRKAAEKYSIPSFATPQQPARALTDWRHRCANLVDIYDDALNNSPENRCYVDGAFKAEIDEVRVLLATGGDHG